MFKRNSAEKSKNNEPSPESRKSLFIENEEENLEKTDIEFQAKLKQIVILLTNNNTLIPDKYSAQNIKLYKECQCMKCSPNLYENWFKNQKKNIEDNEHNESFKTAEDFRSFKSEEKDSHSSADSETQEHDKYVKRCELFEKLKNNLVRKIILVIELENLCCKINIMDKIIKNAQDVQKMFYYFIIFKYFF